MMVFKNMMWFPLSLVIFWSCGDKGVDSPVILQDTFPEKSYTLDETGHVISTEMSVNDFSPSTECEECHPDHYSEWQESMHAYAMKDPIFFSGWNGEQQNRPETGERFCIQCHNPIALVTGYSLEGFATPEDLANSDVPEAVKEGIGCDVCHTVTGLSTTVVTGDDVAANASYHFNPGENIKYGSVEDPEFNEFHESAYSPLFSRSEICLPCHDFVIRGVEAEITYTEWNRIPGLAMSGGMSCQSCHMVEKADGHHDHRFVGVDLDLTSPVEGTPQLAAVEELLQSTLIISFGYPGKDLPSSATAGDTLEIPLTITSLTAHSVPSGVSFAREVWMEFVVSGDNGVIYQSGVISSHDEYLNEDDPNLLLFTTWLTDENGNRITSVTDAHGIINRTLAGMSDRYHTYRVPIPAGLTGSVNVSAKMWFRPFKPALLENGHADLLQNMPVIFMAEATENLPVNN